MRRRLVVYLCIMFVGCAGTQRWFSSCNAESFGADWVVVQVDAYGHPYRCWELHGVSITNEEHSDGIYWSGPNGLVHIAGQYNRVQVTSGQWSGAFNELGLTRETCQAVQFHSATATDGGGG